MLYLVGLGLWDEKDITVRGLEIARAADKVYWESYTDLLAGTSQEKMEELIGEKITRLSRKEVEEEPFFLEEAKNKEVVVLVGGDPLTATTHSDLLLRAREKGVKTRIIHNASIYSAVAETGLQMYKFGRTASVVFWEEKYKPKSFYQVIQENKKRGLHTLLLLDIKPDKTMSPSQAIDTLIKVNSEFKKEEIVVFSRAGSSEPSISYGKAEKLRKQDFGAGLHVLVVIGDLHPMEKEMLKTLNNTANPKALNNRNNKSLTKPLF